MSAAFTSGPWTTNIHVDRRAAIEIMGGGNCVAECWPSLGAHQKNLANAHLIAAAPELYEQLLEANQCLADVASGKGGWAWESVLDSCETVLAKARGEA